jgi:hypothetical protein
MKMIARLHKASKLVALVALLLTAFTGCAGIQNTVQQDLVYEAFRQCRYEGRWPADILLTRVEPDGRYWVLVGGAGISRVIVFQCVDEKVAAAGAAPSQKRTASTPTSTLGVASAPRSSPDSVLAPSWKPGDQWAYRYDGATGSGTYVWSVDREETIDGVPHYVIKNGTRESFYRKSDIAFTRETVDGVVVSKCTPSRLPFMWPMRVGQTWEQTYLAERPAMRQTYEIVEAAAVEAEETVTVPAGTFKTLKIVYRNKKTGAIRYEAWYSPELKQAVKFRENLETGTLVRELFAFKLR